MTDDSKEKFLAALRATTRRIEADVEESRSIPMPDDPAVWLDQCDEYVSQLPDEIPQKRDLAIYAQHARNAFNAGHDDNLRLYMLRITRHIEDAKDNVSIKNSNAYVCEKSQAASMERKPLYNRAFAKVAQMGGSAKEKFRHLLTALKDEGGRPKENRLGDYDYIEDNGSRKTVTFSSFQTKLSRKPQK